MQRVAAKGYIIHLDYECHQLYSDYMHMMFLVAFEFMIAFSKYVSISMLLAVVIAPSLSSLLYIVTTSLHTCMCVVVLRQCM